MKKRSCLKIVSVCSYIVIAFCLLGCGSRNQINYEDYLKLVWVSESWHGGYYYAAFAFTISSVENGQIRGYYMTNTYDVGGMGKIFEGEIEKGTAQCFLYKDSDVVGTLNIRFLEDNRIEAAIDLKENTLHKEYIFRPYNIADNVDFRVNQDMTQTVEIDTWGKVNIVVGVYDIRKPYPAVYLTDAHDNILYNFSAGYQNASEVCDVQITDVDGDGLQDVKIITYFPGDLAIEKIERIFYQMNDGEFSTEKFR